MSPTTNSIVSFYAFVYPARGIEKLLSTEQLIIFWGEGGEVLGKVASGIALALLLLSSTLISSFLMQPVWAATTKIYIRADGSVDPLTAPILNVGNSIYTLTENISNSIVVERDNIVIDGANYTIQGTEQLGSKGIEFEGRTNVTTKNFNIALFAIGIYVTNSNSNNITRNNITSNRFEGIIFQSSFGNSISGNNITNSTDGPGIVLSYSSNNNIVCSNNLKDNQHGIVFSTSSYNNTVYENNIKNNSAYGILSSDCSDNNFFGNNITNNNHGIVVRKYSDPIFTSSNHTISGNNITSNNEHGILLSSTQNATISGNNITNNNVYGIRIVGGEYLGLSQDIEVSRNNIANNTGQGILAGGLHKISIFENNFSNNDRVMWLAGGSNNTIFENNFFNNSQAIYFTGSNNRIFKNNFTNNAQVIHFSGVLSSNTSILRNSFTANDLGIYFTGASNNSILENAFANNVQGVYFSGASSNNISNNNLTKDGGAISFMSSSNNLLYGNNISGYSDSGISMDSSHNNTISHNIVMDKGYSGIFLNRAQNTTIDSNIIVNNGLYGSDHSGIGIDYSNNCVITNNNISRNQWAGIRPIYSNYMLISNNTICDNSYGIYWRSSDTGNIIYLNTLNNTVNANSLVGSSSRLFSPEPLTYSYNGTVFVNYLGNFWKDYTGTDTNRDGVGDTKYLVGTNADEYPLINPKDAYILIPPVTEAKMSEVTSTVDDLTATINVQTATLQTQATGDLSGSLNFANLAIVQITSGSFAGKGFSKGAYTATIEGNQYQGDWQGIILKKPEENKIILKGTLSGGLQGILEGSLSESTLGTNIFDKYTANCTISHIGSNLVYATLNLDGIASYQTSVTYPSTTLYVLQTLIQGQASGYYDGPLNVVLTHVRIDTAANPYYGQGFSVLSYTTEFWSGEGWTYTAITSPKLTQMTGLFSDPLLGLVAAKLDENGPSRTLSIQIERIKIGLPPQSEMSVTTWGPNGVSPGQTVNYIIEYKNTGLKPANDVVVEFLLDNNVNYSSSTDGGVYDEFYRGCSWIIGEVPPKTNGNLSVAVLINWGLTGNTIISNLAYIFETPSDNLVGVSSQSLNGANPLFVSQGFTPLSDQTSGNKPNLGLPGVDSKKAANWADWKAFCFLMNLKAEHVYDSGDVIIDIRDVVVATPTYYEVVNADPGNVQLLDSITGMTFSASELFPGAIKNTNWVGPDGKTYWVCNYQENSNNGLSDMNIWAGDYGIVVAFSGGTRTALTAMLHGDMKSDKLVLVSPMAGYTKAHDDIGYPTETSEHVMKRFQFEIEALHAKYPNTEIVIYQSPKDLADKGFTLLVNLRNQQIKFDLNNIDTALWLDQNNVKINPSVLEGTPLKTDPTVINEQTHGSFIPQLKKDLDGKGQTTFSWIQVGRDPNVLYGPEGYVSSEQKLDYKVEFENVGEGIAFGVYFTDTLAETYDTSTLEIGPVYSTTSGSIIANSGVYDSSTRTITWFVGEVGPGQGGYASYSIKPKNNLPEYTEIINYAIVYFPSVPETTRTNAIVSVVGNPDVAVANVKGGSILADGANQSILVDISNKGYYPETFNLSVFANTVLIDTQNVTLLGKTSRTVSLLWDRSKFAAGTYVVRANALPVQGEIETSDNSYQVELLNDYTSGDNIAPTTTLTVGTPKATIGSNLYITSTTPISLSAVDNTDGSGFKTTEYGISNSSYNSGWLTYVTPFQITSLSDGAYTISYRSTDVAGNVETTKTAAVTLDNIGPILTVSNPPSGGALQGTITFSISAVDVGSGLSEIKISLLEANGASGKPVGQENLSPTYDSATGNWIWSFNTVQLPDGYYMLIVDAKDNLSNAASVTVPYSIRNWAVLKLLPQTENSKAGRTMPVKFSLRVDSTVDSTQPFVYSEELTIRIYATSKPGTILQQSTFGTKSTDYRIDTTNELYITNFQTPNAPTAQYTVAIYRGTLLVGSFTFSTTK